MQEGENIVSDNQEVAEVFNEFFVNVARDIGSLKKIEGKIFEKNVLEFVHTNATFVSKVIDKFNVKKATGVDKISVKLLKTR